MAGALPADQGPTLLNSATGSVFCRLNKGPKNVEDVEEAQEELTPEDIMAEARELHYEQIVAMNRLVVS